ncbi:hypothetical protein [Sulfurihydrogenibium azorense]
MSIQELVKKLEDMGYKNIYTWCDDPGTYYDWHTHNSILEIQN